LTKLVGDTRLVAAEEGEIEMHGGRRRGGRQQSKVHLLSGLHLQRFNQIVTVDYKEAVSALPVDESPADRSRRRGDHL
jgi:hypothetical protein